MLLKKSRPHLIHKRHAENKVYIPADSRENQYFLIELELNANDGVRPVAPRKHLQLLKQVFFDACRAFRITNAMFVANDKYVKVRYGEESQVIETEKQFMVFYDPKCHSGYKSSIKAGDLPQKVVFVVLANGDSIREHACQLHQKVTHLVAELAEHTDIEIERFKMRDLQHITFDVLAKEKNNKQTVTHGFREIATRYQSQSLIIPKDHVAHRFVVVNIPIGYELSTECEMGRSAKQNYEPLYAHIESVCKSALQAQNLQHATLLADGSAPFVSATGKRFLSKMGEMTKLGFDPSQSDCQFESVSNPKTLCDVVTLVISPTVDDEVNRSFGRFVNRCNKAIKEIATKLDINPSKQRLMVRFHQHLQYRMTQPN